MLVHTILSGMFDKFKIQMFLFITYTIITGREVQGLFCALIYIGLPALNGLLTYKQILGCFVKVSICCGFL